MANFLKFFNTHKEELLPSEIEGLMDLVLKEKSIFIEEVKKEIRDSYILYVKVYIDEFILSELVKAWSYLRHY